MRQETVSSHQMAAYAQEICRLINKILIPRQQTLSVTIQSLPPKTGLAACRFHLTQSTNPAPPAWESLPNTQALILQIPQHLREKTTGSLNSYGQVRVYAERDGTEHLWIIKRDQPQDWSCQKAADNAHDIVDDHIATRLLAYLQPTQQDDQP